MYSTNLTDSNDQIWVAELRRHAAVPDAWRPAERQQLPLRPQSRRAHRRPSRAAPRRPASGPTVTAVNVTGDGRVPEAELRELLDVDAGDDYDFFAARDAVEDIEEALEERGRLQSRVRLQRQGDATGVTLTLRVRRRARGSTSCSRARRRPARCVDEVRTQWRRGVFDTQRIDDSVDALRGWLMRDNYLQPTSRRRQWKTPATTSGPCAFKSSLATAIRHSAARVRGRQRHLARRARQDHQRAESRAAAVHRSRAGDRAARTLLPRAGVPGCGRLTQPRYEFQGPQARVVLEVAKARVSSCARSPPPATQ